VGLGSIARKRAMSLPMLTRQKILSMLGYEYIVHLRFLSGVGVWTKS
jgi:hypothetical protein